MKEITAETLRAMAFVNSPKMPTIVDDEGRRKQWVGIGWVDEGPANGTEEARVVRPQLKKPKKRKKS